MKNKIVKVLMVEKDLKQKDLARLAGITESSLSHYFKGDVIPKHKTLEKIAKVIGTTVEEIQ